MTMTDAARAVARETANRDFQHQVAEAIRTSNLDQYCVLASDRRFRSNATDAKDTPYIVLAARTTGSAIEMARALVIIDLLLNTIEIEPMKLDPVSGKSALYLLSDDKGGRACNLLDRLLKDPRVDPRKPCNAEGELAAAVAMTRENENGARVINGLVKKLDAVAPARKPRVC